MSKKHSIALVCDYYYPNKGGIESHIHNLAISYKSLGHYVIIITHKYLDHKGIIDNGIKVYYLNIPIVAVNTSFPNLYSNISLISIFINENIEIVHGHQSMSNLTLEALFHAKTIGLKTVLTEHSLFELGGFEHIIVDRLCSLILKSCDQFITVSNTTKVNFVERTGVEWNKVSVIQNAIDTNIFYRSGKSKIEIFKIIDKIYLPTRKINTKKRENSLYVKENICNSNNTNFKEACNKFDDYERMYNDFDLRLTKGKIKIIIVSRLVKRKGIDLLLEIIPTLFNKLKNIAVIIVGDGPFKDNIEQMIDQNNLREVHLIGELDHSSIASLLRNCDIFINTSLTEAFCMAILEAAACGCKIVSTNVGGVHEVLPNNVLSLTNIDADEIVESVCRLVNTDSYDITHIVDSVYLWDIVAQKTLKVYECIDSGHVDFRERVNDYHWFWEVICRMYIVYEYIFVLLYLKLYH